MLCFITPHLCSRYYCLISPQTLRKKQAGLTLLEIMIVMIIMSILVAMAIPSYVATVDKFRYGHAQTQMDCLKKEIIAYQMEYGDFPAEVTNGIPSDSQCFSAKDIPYESKFDYNQWSTGGLNSCYIGITFLGKDKQKNSQDSDYIPSQPGFHKDGDDLILSIGTFDYGCTEELPPPPIFIGG